MQKQILEQVKRAIRQPYAWPGGYPVYTILTDGTLLCRTCARENFKLIAHSTKTQSRDGWQAAGADVLWEGEEFCGHCNIKLESAYGESEE